MALSFAASVRGTAVSSRPSTATAAARPAAAVRAVTVEARFRGVGTDLTKVPQFARHANDCGSTEVQIARLSARVTQLTSHLQAHRKDFAATRGLMLVLGQRRRLLRYLFKQDRAAYDRVIAGLGIRAVKVQASRGVMVKLGGGGGAAAAAAEAAAAE